MTKIDKITGLTVQEAWAFWIAIALMLVLYALPMLGLQFIFPTSVEGLYSAVTGIVS
ncbi:MAG: hypothetical protein J4432_05100 [DPANN group archaeon]|nr:hypothetical protein [DPANN group archaeon]